MKETVYRFSRRLSWRLARGADLDSNVGIDGPLGLALTFPFWWMLFGLFFVLCYWFASLALNTVGVQKGTFYQGAGYNGKQIHNQIVTAGMGKWSGDYVDSVDIKSGEDRVIDGAIDKTVIVGKGFFLASITVKAGSMSREEQFYSHPPKGNWE